MSYGDDLNSRNIELGALDLKAKAKKLVDELRSYKSTMKTLGRNGIVLRLRHPDYLELRETAKRLAKVDSFDDMLLDGFKVFSYLD